MAISNLFAPGTGSWSLAAGVTQPIFQGGTLRHRQRAAEAAYDQAAAQYRSTVLSAFQNVADTLHAIQCDADAVKAAVIAEQAASKSLAIAHRQMELGDIGYSRSSMPNRPISRQLSTECKPLENRYADTAALFAALGGGWWNRPDEVAKGGH